ALRTGGLSNEAPRALRRGTPRRGDRAGDTARLRSRHGARGGGLPRAPSVKADAHSRRGALGGHSGRGSPRLRSALIWLATPQSIAPRTSAVSPPPRREGAPPRSIL